MLGTAIIGGGLCGLALAAGLQAQGRTFALFEARPRLGGRILSVASETAATRLDLGPSWYWPDIHPGMTVVEPMIAWSSDLKCLGVIVVREAKMARIVPNLWFAEKAQEAAAFYASVLPNSKVDSVTSLPADSPSGPAGSVKVVEFTLIGQPFMAISAGPLDEFNHSISLMVQCDDQAEIDRLWAALSDGGKIEQCGWLKDRYGLSWQIAPAVLGDMMKDSDRARAKRVAEAMLKMIKLDIEGLKEAYEGRSL